MPLELDISENHIGNSGAEKLTAVLKYNKVMNIFLIIIISFILIDIFRLSKTCHCPTIKSRE